MDLKKENNEIIIQKKGKLKEFHDFLINNKKTKNDNKETENEYEENNIYFKYLKNPNIIFQDKGDINNNNLKLLFKELNDDIDNGYNILLPFLENIPQNLVKAYIESDLDNINTTEEGTQNEKGRITFCKMPDDESLYQKLFKKLKYNCFIHKQVIANIYEYFSDLYHKKNEIKDDDKILKKLNKMINLFKIFYENEENKNISSICSLGGILKLGFNKEIDLSKEIKLSLKINILTFFFEDIIKNSNLLKINDIEEKYECILNNISEQKLEYINFIISLNKIDIEFKTNKKKMTITENVDLGKIQEISFFQNFYGQISSIEVLISRNKKSEKFYFYPISIRNGEIYYLKRKIGHNTKLINNSPKIIICDQNFVKINYLNYNQEEFDIIDYFGGVIQFLPFYQIIQSLNDKKLYKMNEDVNKIKENNNVSMSINKTNENTVLIIRETLSEFANFIITRIAKKLLLTKNGFKYYKKYAIFIFYLILNLELDLNIVFEFDNEKEKEKINKQTKLKSYIEFLKMIYYTQKNTYDFNPKAELTELIMFDEINNEVELNIFKVPKKPINQLYTQYMKELFIYNNFWSKKNIFFKTENSKNIKYKQINYYTKNFQLPYFYPILQIDKYYPKFSKLRDGIFLGDDKNILKYDFDLKINKRSTDVINVLTSNNKDNNKDFDGSEPCCLIKNTHHVKGKLFLLKSNDPNKNKNIELIFQSNSNEMCNRNNDNKRNNDKDNLCYGAVFICPTKENNRSIIIKSNDILFLIYRIYFRRLSAIEIFTINNKSYYFNFKNPFDNNNVKKNVVLNEFRLNPLFKDIKTKKEKIGLYNIKYESYLFPLFKDDINIWDKKIKYFCIYDSLILINLFSNRSYRDIYQFPIFPTLYNLIEQKRNMGEQIGFQEITKESKERKKTILVTYNAKEEESDESEEEKYLFNIHYSNPAFIFNFLLRVLPYSFLAVEFQGDDFDNPNRLFYSIVKSLKSNLSLKSDLREMIPELYYMIELLYNKNYILFDSLYDGSKIDYVNVLPEKEERKLVTEIEKMESMFNFLYEMRVSLEEQKDINKWINIIFGIKQKYSEYNNKRYNNYEKYSEISFKYDPEIFNNSYVMDLTDFGLLPYQLFNKAFPIKEIENKYKKDLDFLNSELFKEEHISQINSPLDSFICKGSTFINNNYIQKIDPKEQINNLDYYEFPSKYSNKLDINLFNKYIFKHLFGFIDMNAYKQNKSYSGLVNYYFVGDIYGKISIYSLLKAKSEKSEEEVEIIIDSFDIENEEINIQNIESNKEKCILNYTEPKKLIFPIIKNNKIIFEFELKLIKSLYNHSDEIKYIDFNPRLNILLTYSLDNYINIYIFPKFKLINVIDTNSFKDKNDKLYFDEVLLFSYPFPIIICHNKENIYILSINGELLKYKKLNEHKVIFYIDKNLGLAEDMVQIFDNNGMRVFNYRTN